MFPAKIIFKWFSRYENQIYMYHTYINKKVSIYCTEFEANALQLIKNIHIAKELDRLE